MVRKCPFRPPWIHTPIPLHTLHPVKSVIQYFRYKHYIWLRRTVSDIVKKWRTMKLWTSMMWYETTRKLLRKNDRYDPTCHRRLFGKLICGKKNEQKVGMYNFWNIVFLLSGLFIYSMCGDHNHVDLLVLILFSGTCIWFLPGMTSCVHTSTTVCLHVS